MLRAVARSLSFLFLGLLLATGPLGAARIPEHPWCGTGRHGVKAQAAVHLEHQRRLERETLEKGLAPSFPEATRVGEVAVLVDDGSLIVNPSRVDLDDFGVQFVPQKKGGFVVSPSSDPVGGEIGERLALSDDDVREISFPKGFKFRFFNKNYTKLFVHSDGNLTFGTPDAESSERDLVRLIGGPPRIAPLFADLNPEIATGNGGVYVLASKAKIVVTWLEVPEFGQSSPNTFQAVLYPTGRITFAFGRLDTVVAVVGIAPGGGGDMQVLDYTESLPSGVLKAGIAERFAAERSVDDLGVARAFFREFADDYDHLIVFLDFPHSLGDAFAYELTIKNEIHGIGNDVFDSSGLAGSKGRLRSFVQMGALNRYPVSPEEDILGTNSSLDVLAHEAGHRWLATFNFLDEGGQGSDALLGRQRAHWSFCHNSLASLMEGNRFREDGGDRFTSVGATEQYSPLDLYGMGLIPAGDVPPFYYVDGCNDRERAPAVGVVIQGRRVDVTIDQIIAAEGPREPAANRAPHSFKLAFVLVANGGQFPSTDSIAKVDRIRAAFEPHFARVTDGLGTVSTALKPKPRK